MKRAAAVLLSGLAVAALPVSAQGGGSPVIVEGIAAGVLTGLTCTVAALNADEDAEQGAFDRRGWLLGAAGTYAVDLFDEGATPDLVNAYGPDTSLSADDSFGFNGQVGYRCHSRFSSEVEVEWLEGFDSRLSEAGLGQVASLDIEALLITANTKGYLLTGRYQPFLLVGGGVMRSEVKVRESLVLGVSDVEKDSEFAMRFGGGIDVYATENAVVTLNADYVFPFGNLSDMDYISIGWGFQYRF